MRRKIYEASLQYYLTFNNADGKMLLNYTLPASATTMHFDSLTPNTNYIVELSLLGADSPVVFDDLVVSTLLGIPILSAYFNIKHCF